MTNYACILFSRSDFLHFFPIALMQNFAELSNEMFYFS